MQYFSNPNKSYHVLRHFMLRENNTSMIWRLNMPITGSRRNTSIPEVLVFLPEAASNGKTLFTGEELFGTPTNLFMGVQDADGARLEKCEHHPSQIRRDHHVTRSLLSVWWQLSRARGEAAFVPTQAFQSPTEIDRPHNAQELIVHLERLCGQQAMELDLLRSEVGV
jgi:hypothetical protein